LKSLAFGGFGEKPMAGFEPATARLRIGWSYFWKPCPELVPSFRWIWKLVFISIFISMSRQNPSF